MIDEKKEAALLMRVKELLAPVPAAEHFVVRWTEYVHLIDDIIDGDVELDANVLLKLTAWAAEIFSSEYYHQFRQFLYPVVILTNNTYGDSVQWEHSDEAWKRRHADALRHTGYDMFFIIVMIHCGYEKMREISIEFREYSHLKHLKDYSEDPQKDNETDK